MNYGKDLSELIIAELYETVELLAGNMYILANISSFRDTMTDIQTLEAIQSWNKDYRDYQEKGISVPYEKFKGLRKAGI